MDYNITTNPCTKIDIPSCYTGEIRVSTTEPDGTAFQVHVLIDGKIETIDTVSVGGYIPFTPMATIYDIPFWITIGTILNLNTVQKLHIIPHPSVVTVDNIIINI